MPTLAADDALADCLRSLDSQTFDRFEVVVVDNSGTGRARVGSARMRILSNDRNVGFGAAINQGIRDSESPYIAALNDDAVPHPEWLAELVKAAESRPKAGMFASQVRMSDTARLDSAGMLIALDGSSKQRGHGEPPAQFAANSDILFPTGSAALYRRKMLDEIGLFDERFFLYCEDTDLGLRARWAGWEAAYVAGAVVDHAYSKSAGRASALKAYYVERNRLYTVMKNLSLFDAGAGQVLFARAILLAPGVHDHADWKGSGVSRCRPHAMAAAVPRFAGPRIGAGSPALSFSRAPAHLQDPQIKFRGISRAAGRAFHFAAQGG